MPDRRPSRIHHRRPIIALGLALGLLAPTGASPAAAAGDESIVYMSATIVTVTDPSGSAPQAITPSTGQWTPPRISPDGSTVAYLGVNGFGIWLVGIDGSNPRLILPQSTTGFEGASWLAWSPEGDRIAWAKTFDTRIRFIDTNGTAKGTIKVCTGLGWTRPAVMAFDWARDGRLWVSCFDNTSGATSGYQVRLMSQTGGKGNKRYQANESITSVRADPTGQRALVVVGPGVGQARFFVDAAGAIGGSAGPDLTYAWSPDGTRLVGWGVHGDAPNELFTVPVGGGTRTWLGVFGINPDWGPIPPVCGAGFEPSNGGKLIIGTPGPDVLEGTPGNDVICGLGGDDIIRGLGGDDVIFGGPGDDVLRGGPGRDRLSGGKGSDSLYGGPGNDHLTGGPGKDRLEGEGGNDTIIARDGIRDIVRGGPGTDRAKIDAGLDDVTGVETLLASVAAAAVDAGDEQPLDDDEPGELDGDGGSDEASEGVSEGDAEESSDGGGADPPATDDPDASPASDAPGGDDGGGEAASTWAWAAW